jgi:hypothetical protein
MAPFSEYSRYTNGQSIAKISRHTATSPAGHLSACILFLKLPGWKNLQEMVAIVASRTAMDFAVPYSLSFGQWDQEKKTLQRFSSGRAGACQLLQERDKREPVMGIEPMTPVLPRLCATAAPHGQV